MNPSSLPIMIIMYGPQGSGKSSGLEWYLTHVLSSKSPKPSICHLDLDNFVMNCAGYKTGKIGHENDAAFLSDLFKDHVNEGRRMFEDKIARDLRSNKSIAIDVVGRISVSWLDKFQPLVRSNKYQVHVVYPLVPSKNKLMSRLHTRFLLTKQPPAPITMVQEALKDAPHNLRHVLNIFSTDIEQVTIYENSSTYAVKPVLFQYKPHELECTVLQHIKFSPCKFKFQ